MLNIINTENFSNLKSKMKGGEKREEKQCS